MTDRDRSATDGPSPVDERAIRDRLVAEHAEVLDAVAAAGDAVEAAGDTLVTTGDAVAPQNETTATDTRGAADGELTDGRALGAALERELADGGVLDRLPGVLETAVDAASVELVAEPVAAPPYVTVTGRGPVLRGPTEDGRLVVVIGAFRVERDPCRYVRTPAPGRTVVQVEFER
ncbi:hypothetical protein [Halosimplex amylolyticum]|uniref:hypothetical protein n=1 Tax=Halosimplex amylolyticum TaxID=3396616 RepID=UPI003F55EFEA